MKIKYKLIPGRKGYRAGTDGSIWSRWGYQSSGRAGIRRVLTNTWRRLAEFRRNDYWFVNIGRIHLLIMKTFKGNRPRNMECRHLDGNPHNNCINNLTWGTKKQNWQDRIKHGNDICGDKNPWVKYSEADVAEMRRLRESGWALKAICNKFGISKTYACTLCKRKLRA